MRTLDAPSFRRPSKRGATHCSSTGPARRWKWRTSSLPSILELQVDGAIRLADDVRSAGVVFVGPWAPASIGDYVAGTNHILPTARTARFSSALRVDDFRKHIGVVSVDRRASTTSAPHVVAIADAEGLSAHARSVSERSDSDAADRTNPGRARSPRSEMRPEVGFRRSDRDLVEMKGYHSPQVDVAVRLNTNESPFPPPAAWLSELAEELGRIDFNRYPDRNARGLREAIARHERVDPSQVFCANGSNEVLQSLLLAYGGQGRSVAVFEPTYALHRHIAMLAATGVVTGWRAADHSIDAEGRKRGSGELAGGHIPLFAEQPDGSLGAPRARLCRFSRKHPASSSSTRPTVNSRTTSAIDLVRDRMPGSERLVVVRTFSKTWSMAALRLGYMVGHPEVVSACEAVSLPYHLDAVAQAAGVLALRHEAAMRERIAKIVEERTMLESELGKLEVDTWPSDANFILFRPTSREARQVWSDLLEEEVLVRDCSGWPGLSGCLRVTVGTPEENLRFLERAQQEPRKGRGPALNRRADRVRRTKETNVEVSVCSRGKGARHREHRAAFLRPHARTARASLGVGPERIGRGRSPRRRAPHRRGRRNRARTSCRRGARRQGRRPAVRVHQPAARRSSRRRRSRPLGSAPTSRTKWSSRPDQQPLGNPPFDPQLAEEFFRAFAGWSRGHDARAHGDRSECTPCARGHLQGGCALLCTTRHAVEGEGVPSTKGTLGTKTPQK